MRVEDANALKEFNEGWDKAHTTGDVKPPDIGGGDPNLGGGDSNLMSNLQQNTADLMNTMNQPFTPPSIPTTGDTCDQCHLLHPPVRPGETCPNAVEKPKPPENNGPFHEPPKPLTEGSQKTEVKQISDVPTRRPKPPPAPHAPAREIHQTSPVEEYSPRHDMAPASAGSAFEVKPEPTPLADNNIPTEIHINKYLSSWGDMIQAHCNNNAVQNTKKLMRHLTIEITDFLETYKGK